MSIQKSWIKVFKPEKQFSNDVIKNEGSFDENGTNLDSEVLDYSFEAENINKNDGEKILKDLDKELPDDYHVSAEHKVLFGTLEEKKDNSGFPIILRNYATFTALGLEYGEKRIPYKMEFQQEIHEKNFQDFLDKNDDEDDYADLSEKIDKENEFWEEPLSEIMVEQLLLLCKRENRASISKLIQERKALPVSAENEYGHDEKSFLKKEFDKYELAVEQELRKKYKRKSKESETDYENRIITKLNSKRYNYIEKNYKNKKEKDIQDFAIKEGIMTEDECKIFNHYTKKRDAIIKKISDFQDYAGNKIPGNRLEMLRGDIKQYLKIYIMDELIKSSGIDDYYKKNVRGRLRIDSFEYKKIDGDSFFNKMVEKTPEILKHPEIMNEIENLKEMAKEFYLEIIPKFDKAKAGFFNSYNAKKYELDQRASDLREKNKALDEDEISRTLLPSEVGMFKKQIADLVFPDDDGFSDVLIIPTGIVAVTKDGDCKFGAISPLDERVLAIIEDVERKKCWIKTWEKKQGENDSLVRELLAKKIDDEKATSKDAFDERGESYLDINQLTPPVSFDKRTGKVNDSMQEKDYRILEKFVPLFGDFIKGVDLRTIDRDINLTSTRLEIVGYLSGDDYKKDMLLVSGDCKINTRELDILFYNTTPEKMQKLYARVSAELGISLYEHLSKEKRDAFNEIIGLNNSISETEFYKLFHKSVGNATERRRLIRRTVFLTEFNNYIIGKASRQINEFFDSFKKQSQLVQ